MKNERDKGWIKTVCDPVCEPGLPKAANGAATVNSPLAILA
jgi:hypothetical protein